MEGIIFVKVVLSDGAAHRKPFFCPWLVLGFSWATLIDSTILPNFYCDNVQNQTKTTCVKFLVK